MCQINSPIVSCLETCQNSVYTILSSHDVYVIIHTNLSERCFEKLCILQQEMKWKFPTDDKRKIYMLINLYPAKLFSRYCDLLIWKLKS